jgi:uncharacterized protein
MRHLVSFLTLFALVISHGAAEETQKRPLPLRGFAEVSQAQVKLTGGFWGPRLKASSTITIPHTLTELEENGHVTNFDKAANKEKGGLSGHHAYDSDLYKVLEGALISLNHYPDPALQKRVDGIINRVLAAQQEDGFLISWFIVNGLDKRWDDLMLEHQMYNAGHFFEMATEHQNLTQEAKVINSAKRFADHIDGIFGENKRYDVDGHQEIELALIKLYRNTGERRYLDLARFFLEERGYAHGTSRKPFDPKSQIAPEKADPPLHPSEFYDASLRFRNERMQDHKPLAEQFEAVGHAVRAGYVYSAMADVVRFMQAPAFEVALDHLWNDVVDRKMYITGNIGTWQYRYEGFGDPYKLPNQPGGAYNESCAAIAHVFWQQRMNLLKGEAKYADIMELALYNGVLSSVSLKGDRFFYENPLSSDGGQVRRAWMIPGCCPTNVARVIPQVGGLVYAQKDDQIMVNLYAAGDAKIKLPNDLTVSLNQKTEYPWEGKIQITVGPSKPANFSLNLRIPSWALAKAVPGKLYKAVDATVQPLSLLVNNEKTEVKIKEDGYIHLKRDWKVDDKISLDLPMPVQRIVADERVEDDRGKVTLMRGPLVYCLEGNDQPNVNFASLSLPRAATLISKHEADLLGGVTVIQGEGLAEGKTPVKLTAIPYYAWQNREKGAMQVWINEGFKN